MSKKNTEKTDPMSAAEESVASVSPDQGYEVPKPVNKAVSASPEATGDYDVPQPVRAIERTAHREDGNPTKPAYFVFGVPNYQIAYPFVRGKDGNGKVISEARTFESGSRPYCVLDEANPKHAPIVQVLRDEDGKGIVREIDRIPPVKMVEKFDMDLNERIKDVQSVSPVDAQRVRVSIVRSAFKRWIQQFGG